MLLPTRATYHVRNSPAKGLPVRFCSTYGGGATLERCASICYAQSFAKPRVPLGPGSVTPPRRRHIGGRPQNDFTSPYSWLYSFCSLHSSHNHFSFASKKSLLCTPTRQFHPIVPNSPAVPHKPTTAHHCPPRPPLPHAPPNPHSPVQDIDLQVRGFLTEVITGLGTILGTL